MADLPIDIHYQKLTEWLLSREKIKKRWQEGLPALKTKVETLRLRLPDDLDIDVASVSKLYFLMLHNKYLRFCRMDPHCITTTAKPSSNSSRSVRVMYRNVCGKKKNYAPNIVFLLCFYG